MVMGPTHALSGAAAWLVASAVADLGFGYEQSAATIAVGTIACTGASLLPDIDCSGRVLRNRGGSTVARTFGVASLFIAEVVEKLCLGLYKITRTKHDRKLKNGHRTFTHTWLFAVLLGVGVGALAYRYGKPAVVAILFFLIGFAIRGVLHEFAKRKGALLITLLSLAGAFGLYHILPPNESYFLLGAAVSIGCVVHTFGDMLTKMGCPVAFPLPIKKEVWYDVGVPKALAIRAGSKVEHKVLVPAFSAVGIVAMFFLLPEARELLIKYLE
ncbi:MAG: metal-dependent hydrolase [Stackebrandtia sp.]